MWYWHPCRSGARWPSVLSVSFIRSLSAPGSRILSELASSTSCSCNMLKMGSLNKLIYLRDSVARGPLLSKVRAAQKLFLHRPWGFHIWPPHKFLIFWPPPSLVTYGNQLIVFLLSAFWEPPSPLESGRHIWNPPASTPADYLSICSRDPSRSPFPFEWVFFQSANWV